MTVFVRAGQWADRSVLLRVSASYQDAYWKPFFDGFPGAHDWRARVKPDVAVVFFNDHGLNYFLDKMPTFAIGAASEYKNVDEAGA